MDHVYGSLARSLGFGEVAANARLSRRAAVGPLPGFRSARRPLELLRGPDKYKVLERRRRAAQINARHVLDAAE